MLVEIVLWEKF